MRVTLDRPDGTGRASLRQLEESVVATCCGTDPRGIRFDRPPGPGPTAGVEHAARLQPRRAASEKCGAQRGAVRDRGAHDWEVGAVGEGLDPLVDARATAR